MTESATLTPQPAVAEREDFRPNPSRLCDWCGFKAYRVGALRFFGGLTIEETAEALCEPRALERAHEQALLASLSRYPEVVEMAAVQRAPHAMVHYLRDLANDFHTYYNAHQFLVDDAELRDARLTLIQGLRQVVRNGLGLLGVSAPEAM